MNFGQNIFTWLQSNLQPLLLVCIIGMGIYFFVEKKFSKIAGLVVIGIVSVGFVFATTSVKDIFLRLFNQIFN